MMKSTYGITDLDNPYGSSPYVPELVNEFNAGRASMWYAQDVENIFSYNGFLRVAGQPDQGPEHPRAQVRRGRRAAVQGAELPARGQPADRTSLPGARAARATTWPTSSRDVPAQVVAGRALGRRQLRGVEHRSLRPGLLEGQQELHAWSTASASASGRNNTETNGLGAVFDPSLLRPNAGCVHRIGLQRPPERPRLQPVRRHSELDDGFPSAALHASRQLRLGHQG